MQSTTNIGSVRTALIDKLPNAALVSSHVADQSMGLLSALIEGGALFRDNGIRIHVYPFLSEYKITMVWLNGGLYEGTARISKVYKFLCEAGIPINSGWEVSRV